MITYFFNVLIHTEIKEYYEIDIVSNIEKAIT